MNDYDLDPEPSGRNFFTSIHPSVQAALIVAIPFIAVDFFNYYSAGTALVISLPILMLLYIICGALAGFLAAKQGRVSSGFPMIGALAGLTLWLSSTIINTIIGLIIGTASLGVTLLLGIPYLCLCAPLQMIGGGLMGALGGFLLGLFHKGDSSSDSYGA
jgi:hypothetical protein